MTAAALLDRLERVGVSATIDGDEIVLRPGSKLDQPTIDAVREHKPAIVCELLCREQRPIGIIPTPADAIRTAAQLLREGRWPQTPPVCAFHCGQPGETCRRCGASWSEHYPDAEAE